MFKNKNEDYNTEYKLELPQKEITLKKEICAFLNSDGGEIFLGVDDNGKVAEDKTHLYKKWEATISNWIANGFKPEVTHLIKLYPNEKPFRIEVLKGDNKPYCVKDGNEFDFSKVFIRVSSTTRKAGLEELRNMICKVSEAKDTSTSSVQNLTFKYLKSKLKEVNLNFDEQKLKLKNTNNLYNKSALLLSDQNIFETKYLIYEGNNSIALKSKVFSGSILKQIDECLSFFKMNNVKGMTFDGSAQRKEWDVFSDVAFRETIINAFVHRNWEIDTYIKIEQTAKGIKVISPGGIYKININDLNAGNTSTRNKILSFIFTKLKLREDYGTGLINIFNSYSDYEERPQFDYAENTFVVYLPARTLKTSTQSNAEEEVKVKLLDHLSDLSISKQSASKELISRQNQQEVILTNRQELILGLISRGESITTTEMAQKLKISVATIKRELDYLKEKQLISFVGSRKSGQWVLLKDDAK